MSAPELSDEERHRLSELNRRFLALWLIGSAFCLLLGYFLFSVRDAPAVRAISPYFSESHPRISGKYLFFLQFGEQAALFFVSGVILFLPFLTFSFFSLLALRRKLDSRFGRVEGFGANEVLSAVISSPLFVALLLLNFADLDLVDGGEHSMSSLGRLLFGSPIYPVISVFSFFVMALVLANLFSTIEKFWLGERRK